MSRIRSSRRRPPASRPRTVPPVHSLRRDRNTKRRGELAELVFLLIATRLGFGVSKPYGDSERYDFILDSRDLVSRTDAHVATAAPGRRAARTYRAAALPSALASQRPSPLYRVQVKCSTQLLNGLYRINAHHRSGGRAVPYLPGEIDFIAAYIVPEDTWYIIPLHAVRGTSLLFRRKKDHRPRPLRPVPSSLAPPPPQTIVWRGRPRPRKVLCTFGADEITGWPILCVFCKGWALRRPIRMAASYAAGRIFIAAWGH